MTQAAVIKVAEGGGLRQDIVKKELTAPNLLTQVGSSPLPQHAIPPSVSELGRGQICLHRFLNNPEEAMIERAGIEAVRFSEALPRERHRTPHVEHMGPRGHSAQHRFVFG